MQEKSILGEWYDILDALWTFVWTNPSIFEVVMAFWSQPTEISDVACCGEGGKKCENQKESKQLAKRHMGIKNQTPRILRRK